MCQPGAASLPSLHVAPGPGHPVGGPPVVGVVVGTIVCEVVGGVT